MKSLKKCTSLITSAVLAGSMITSCGNTRYGLVVDDEEVRAGVFIFYTISSYYDAAQIVSAQGILKMLLSMAFLQQSGFRTRLLNTAKISLL